MRRCDRYLVCANVPIRGDASIRIVDLRDEHQLVGWDGAIASKVPSGVIQEKWGTVVQPNYLLAHIENIMRTLALSPRKGSQHAQNSGTQGKRTAPAST